MRNAAYLLLLFLFSSNYLKGQILEYTYPDDQKSEVKFSESMAFIVDSSGQLSIEDLLNNRQLPVVAAKDILLPAPPYYLWTSIQLTNKGTQLRKEYIKSFFEVDSIWHYTVMEQQAVDQGLTGGLVSSWDKTPPHVKNLIPVNLAAGETKTIYLRFRIDLASTGSYLERMFTIIPVVPENRFMIKIFVWQSLYLGFMAMFCLLSVFMYSIFRDRIFLYFGLLTLSFGGYFMSINRIFDVFIHPSLWQKEFFLLNFFISGIIFSLSFFIRRYLRLHQHFPKYSLLLIVYAFLIEAFAHFSVLFISHNQMAGIHNPLLLAWVLACFAPIVLLAWRGDRSAKVLFATIGVLFISSAAHLLYIIQKPRSEPLTVSGFQLGTIFFISVLFYDLFTKINTIRQEKERFQELDVLKSRFFANISHEFRTPLTLIKGPLVQLTEKLPKTEDRKLMNMVQRNADRLLQLVNQVLDLSKLEAGKLELQAQETNFLALLKGIVMSFESLAQRKGVSLSFESDQEVLSLWVDPKKVEDIFNNLLSNAFKFTTTSEIVSVRISNDRDWVKVQVIDNGRGIAADQIPYVFNRFFQADNTQADDAQGSGIGLALVKELVSLHGGKIEVNSIEHKQTVFTVRLRKGKAHLSEKTLATSSVITLERGDTSATSAAIFTSAPVVSPPITLASDRKLHDAPLVLIIEDNEDVRYYVTQSLQTSFRIVEAVNGQDGIDKAMEYMPDLIISDVMMPIRNGYEVCRILKDDPHTSHIPLILLTAKAAQEEKRHGLQEGADDYLIKPFDTQELQIRVKNLIDLRQKLRVQFAVGEENTSLDSSLNAVDKAFMQQVFSTIDTQLSNEQLSVDVLAEAVGMSKRHLNRKLTALAGLSANRFIRNYRLQEAMRMLKRKEGNVSEIASATGFSSTAYFVKCFGEKFGHTPGSV